MGRPVSGRPALLACGALELPVLRRRLDALESTPGRARHAHGRPPAQHPGHRADFSATAQHHSWGSGQDADHRPGPSAPVGR
ncbi:hypothetical protein AB0K71_25510 [Streptomyces syringium]|uniref:hypothetical protein n=1 Tax=Streptomyces syringium TaxID=76729 RepID=UPI0033AEDF8C